MTILDFLGMLGFIVLVLKILWVEILGFVETYKVTGIKGAVLALVVFIVIDFILLGLALNLL